MPPQERGQRPPGRDAPDQGPGHDGQGPRQGPEFEEKGHHAGRVDAEPVKRHHGHDHDRGNTQAGKGKSTGKAGQSSFPAFLLPGHGPGEQVGLAAAGHRLQGRAVDRGLPEVEEQGKGQGLGNPGAQGKQDGQGAGPTGDAIGPEGQSQAGQHGLSPWRRKNRWTSSRHMPWARRVWAPRRLKLAMRKYR